MSDKSSAKTIADGVVAGGNSCFVGRQDHHVDTTKPSPVERKTPNTDIDTDSVYKDE